MSLTNPVLGQTFPRGYVFSNPPTAGVLPTAYAGLMAWYDASTYTNADGFAATSFLDQSPNARHLTGTATVKTNILNGKPILRFNGTSDVMALADAAFLSTDYTAIMVLIWRKTATLGGALNTKTGSNDGYNLAIRADNTEAMLVGTNANSTFTYVGGTTAATLNVGRIVTGDHTGSTSNNRIFSNGPLVASATQALSYVAGTPLQLGSFYTNTLRGQVDIAEVAIYNTVLSDADRTSLTQSLGTKWGVAVS